MSEATGKTNEEKLLEALKGYREAFFNKGKKSSIRDWNTGMKIADAKAASAILVVDGTVIGIADE